MRRPTSALHQVRPARGGAARHGPGHRSLNRYVLDGHIVGAGFTSGDRIVVGIWNRSPVGAFADVMWARPDGTRILLSPDADAEAFITAVYRFDQTEIVPVEATVSGRNVDVRAGSLTLSARAALGWFIPRPRPRWFTRWVEGPVARRLMDVHTYGVSPTGVHEWYQASRWQPLRSAVAAIDGRDLGPFVPLDPPLGVGFTDPPPRPSLVTVRPVLADPSGRLDELVALSRR